MTQEYQEIHLHALAHDGRAVGRALSHMNEEAFSSQNAQDTKSLGPIVFVQGGLPGQMVRARITKSKKNFSEAICTEVLQESADHIAPACPQAHLCGGCPLQSMPYEKQLFWKERMVKEALQRIGKVAHVPFEKIYPSPLQWHYRNKMEFAVGKTDSNELILGLRAKGSHSIVAAEQCLLMPKEFVPVLIRLRQLMTATGLQPWENTPQNSHKQLWRHVIIRRAYDAHKNNALGCHVQIITAPASAKSRHTLARLGQSLLDANLGVFGFVHEERHSTSLYAQGERCITQLGQKYVSETLANITYTLHHSAFFQVNTMAAEHLCTEATAMAALSGEEILWDIFCGAGAPGLGLAGKAKEVYGVELNTHAIQMAKNNAQNLGYAHCHYIAGNAERIIKNPPAQGAWPRPHVILIDPPRAGIHQSLIQTILHSHAHRLIYISCNPATLARDVALLQQKYTLERVCAADLFPHTAHIESCALLTRT